MSLKTITTSLFIIGFLATTQTPAHAYTVTKSQALEINDTYTFYLITYAFGHENRSFTLPKVATRGESPATTDLEYTLKTPEGLTVKDGITAAMIWSRATTTNNQFVVPRGTSESFTLAVLHAKSASSSRANTLSVTNLPFMIETTPSNLKTHELKAYQVSATGTPAVDREAE